MESSDASSPRREYITLNAVRGIAAICVMLFHGVGLVGEVAPRGYLAVDLFFVLSGFVIEHAYGDRLESSLSVRTFIGMRLVRFWPLYVLGLGREALLIISSNDYALSFGLLSASVLVGLLFLPFPIPQRGGDLFPINIPSWSLFFELLVNIIYVLIRPFLGWFGIISVIIASSVTLIFLIPPNGIGHVGVTIHSFAGGCARTLLSFTIGLLIYRLRLKGPVIPVPFLLSGVAATLAFPWGGVAYDLAFIFVISPIIVILGSSVEPSGWMKSLAIWLGVISFPLYAVHRPILSIAEAVSRALPVSAAVIGWVTALGLVAISISLANYYDAPVRGRLMRWLRKPSH